MDFWHLTKFTQLYQIPLSDREALLREQAEEERATAKSDQASDKAADEAREGDQEGDQEDPQDGTDDVDDNRASRNDVENVGGDAHEEASTAGRARAHTRKYKIQEVIKRRQIILVQVVKEERGNKGAALTTYLSLAGRYCVLMPNTARGGGISRKINHTSDRKKLKKIAENLDVPNGMGLIIRTAGAQRTATEIKRDYNYLTKTWETIRALTLKSSAPALVYEEGTLIRRCIRDLYDKDFDEVVVDGADAYQEARSYMKLLMPSHLRKVKQHKEDDSLYRSSGVEDQLTAMFNPVVTLRSGGYLVINQTEALVAVDVNSGKSTGEFSIEKTALNTNLEAAEEVARQMRLRDLAGLIVIDFIDMDENRNNRAVEKRLKDALKSDRARIQVGRISSFGLLEMSRQRTRSGVLDSSSHTCKHCQGSGLIRSVESRSLHILRALDARAADAKESEIILSLPGDVAVYLLNQKRGALRELEDQHGCRISISIDDDLMAMEMRFGDTNAEATRMDAAATPPPRPHHDRKNRSPQSGRDGRPNGRSNGKPNDKANEKQNDAQTDETHEEVRGEMRASHDKNSSDRSGQSRHGDGTHAADDSGEEPRGRRRRRGRRGGRNRRHDGDTASTQSGAGDSPEAVLSTANGEGSKSSIETSSAQMELSAPDTSDRSAPASSREEAVQSGDIQAMDPHASAIADAPSAGTDAAPDAVEATEAQKAEKKPRRRRKKEADDEKSSAAAASTNQETKETPLETKQDTNEGPKKATKKGSGVKKGAEPDTTATGEDAANGTSAERAEDAKKPKKTATKRGRPKKDASADKDGASATPVSTATPEAAAPETTPPNNEDKPARRGWWRRAPS